MSQGRKHRPARELRWKLRVGIAVLATFFITCLGTLIIINLSSGEKQIRYHLEHRFGVEDPAFVRTMSNVLGPPLLEGNEIKALQNGDQIFPPMLEAIRSAQKTITFETYIYWSGQIGQQFTDVLCERARAGVKVHVLMDWVGTDRLEDTVLKQMKAAGVQVERYNPPRWYTLSRMNSRTHRKLLVVDGKIAFTGGVGIADPWLGNADRKDRWRDSHYRLTGPAVAQMQAAFNDNWIKTRAQVLFGPEYFPELEPAGDCLAQLFKSSEGGGSESVRLMYLLSIASAKRYVKLSAAYFVPDDLAIETFVAARKRGVKIEIIVAGKNTDAPAVRSASRSRWRELLDAGVEIYEYQPARYHCKVMIVDDVWVSVGSTNFDDRSFRLNDEANLNIYDRKFALEQAAVFEEDKKNSRKVHPSEHKQRSATTKLVDAVSGAFRRQL